MKLELKILLLFGIIISGVLILGNILPIYATHDEPFVLTWTIINYYSSSIAPISQLAQEQAIERSLKIWTDNLNMELVFVKNANKQDVYCWATFERSTAIGHGGGIPGQYCQFTIGSNQFLYVGERPDSTFIHRNLESLARHEGGHGMGLHHYNVGSCVMFTNYGDGLVSPCDAEIKDLKRIWIGIENPPPIPIRDGSMKSISAPSQVVQGDIVPIAYTIENLSNIDYQALIWFYDRTGNSVIQSGPFHNLAPGETLSGTVLWDTSTTSLGLHEIRGYWLTIAGDINSVNNLKTIFVTVNEDVIPPPPPPEPEPEPEIVNYFIDYDETVSIQDFINVTHIIGPESPDPKIEELEAKIVELEMAISDLEDIIVSLTDVIAIANSVITDLNTLTTDLENNIILLNDEIVSVVDSRNFWQNQATTLSNTLDQIRALVAP